MSSEREIIAVRKEEVAGHQHIVAVKLKDGTVQSVAEVIAAMNDPETHCHYVMRPPEGAPAYQAHQETGLLLEVQTRPCPDCGEELLFA